MGVQPLSLIPLLLHSPLESLVIEPQTRAAALVLGALQKAG